MRCRWGGGQWGPGNCRAEEGSGKVCIWEGHSGDGERRESMRVSGIWLEDGRSGELKENARPRRSEHRLETGAKSNVESWGWENGRKWDQRNRLWQCVFLKRDKNLFYCRIIIYYFEWTWSLNISKFCFQNMLAHMDQLSNDRFHPGSCRVAGWGCWRGDS